MKINILTENTTTAGRGLNYPLQKHFKKLRKLGLSLNFIWDNTLNSNIYDCDLLFVNSKIYRTWWNSNKNEMLEQFKMFRNRIGKVCYFDTTDSSGTLQSELLPYVTKYFKSFLLKETRQYQNAFYGGRIFTNYYHNQYGVDDTEEIPTELCLPIQTEFLPKLGVSWNSTLYFGDDLRNRFRNRLRGHFFATPSQNRPLNVSCRMSMYHKRQTIKYQRQKIKELLTDHGVSTEKVPPREYFKEMRNAKIAVSPFGWGEFAYRDFEIFTSGCLLFKPDMSHISTWPDLYINGETCVFFSWDFSDFNELLSKLLSDIPMVIKIAANGQDRYRWFLDSDESSDQFCNHVIAMVESVEMSSSVNT